MPVRTPPPLRLGQLVGGDRRGFLRRLGIAGWAASAGIAHAAPLPAHRIAALRKSLRGQVIGRGDAAWPGWCDAMVWQQRKPAQRPPLIVQAASETDVIEAVRFARRNGLKVAVRTGGHSVWASFMRGDGLLIDMSQFKRTTFNRDDRSAVVQPALWGSQLIERGAPLNLAFPVAHCGQVGLGGYLIGGGLGLNHDAWGHMACFSIRGADVVTPRGELISIDAKRHPSLFWALRGAGQGFPGIVTKLHLALQPRPREVRSSVYTLPMAAAPVAAAWLQDATTAQRGGVEVLLVVARGDGAEPVVSVIVNAFASSAAEARASLAPFAASEFAKDALSKSEAQPSSLEKLLREGIQPRPGDGRDAASHGVDSIWTASAESAVAALAEHLPRAASPLAHAVIAFKSNRALPGDAACSRTDRAHVGLHAVWQGQDGAAANLNWLRAASQALQPFASGHYINEVDIDAAPQRALDCFSDRAWRRLADVRHHYDPDRAMHGFTGFG
jgi:FAD/FMN-containing dehydrogenase